MGLAISKEIVEMMGGQIGVSSREHEGSCFTFSVILRHAPLKRSTLATDTATYDDGAIPGRLAPAPRVLLAKDNLVNQQVALAMLESLGCDVHVVPDGAEACAAVLAGDFDCVFLDWQMPNMDGIEAARAIRHEEARRGRMPARLIALTANVSAADQQRCRDAGMNGFVGKPFTRTDLIAALDETSVAMTESSSSVVRLFDIENDQSKQRQ